MKNSIKTLTLMIMLAIPTVAFCQWQNNGNDIIYTLDKVGIGTNSPSAQLTVIGGARFKEVPAANSGVMYSLGYNSNPTGFHPNHFVFFSAYDWDNPSSPPPIYLGDSVMIGTLKQDANFALSVDGAIKAREVVVTANGWADFVFKPDYQLRPLAQLEQEIQDLGHLPEIPSADEVRENGVGVAEMQVKLLQKIEELTLYVIDLKKENLALQNRIEGLEEKP